MNLLAIIGAFIITLSLLAYGIGSISLVRFRIIGSLVVVFLSLGVILDLTAISLMVIGAKSSIITAHSIIGYLAFLSMFVLTTWVWKIFLTKGKDFKAGKKMVLYTKVAYFFWVLAYLLGSILIIWM